MMLESGNHINPIHILCGCVLFLAICCLNACASQSNSSGASGPEASVPFQYVGGHLLKVPVRVNDSIDTYFILDTGIGVNILSKTLCDRMGCTPSGHYTGKRMSGQALRVPIATVGSLSFASERKEKPQVAVWDMKGFLPDTPEFSDVQGFLSLSFFESIPFSINYRTGQIVIESEMSLGDKADRGVIVPIKLDYDQKAALTIWLSLEIPGEGPPLLVEVDTGSGSLILNSQFMPRLKVDPNGSDVKRVEGRDETGHAFSRYFTQIEGSVQPVGAPMLGQTKLNVMFQKIIHDGLVGDAFLSRFTVTFDLPHSRMIFSR